MTQYDVDYTITYHYCATVFADSVDEAEQKFHAGETETLWKTSPVHTDIQSCGEAIIE